jgi:hypothetical protein
MHRTTLSFGNEDWLKIRRLAAEKKMTLSQLVTWAVSRLGAQKAPVERAWNFDWKPKPMGLPRADFRTREGIYEFSD